MIIEVHYRPRDKSEETVSERGCGLENLHFFMDRLEREGSRFQYAVRLDEPDGVRERKTA